MANTDDEKLGMRLVVGRSVLLEVNEVEYRSVMVTDCDCESSSESDWVSDRCSVSVLETVASSVPVGVRESSVVNEGVDEFEGVGGGVRVAVSVAE